MTAQELTSALGHYKVFMRQKNDADDAIQEVIDELEQHNIPLNQTQFILSHSESEFVFVAICRR